MPRSSGLGVEIGGKNPEKIQVRVSRCNQPRGVRTQRRPFIAPSSLLFATMMNRFCLVVTLCMALLASLSHGFVQKTPAIQRTSSLPAKLPSKQDIVKAATTAAVVISTSPLVALAEEDYEYGAVNAPIGLAWGAGVLAILTALLPIALRGGEDAFNEMKERDSDTFGKAGKDVLKSRRK